MEAYRNLKEEIEKTVSRINGKYSSVDWSPISYQLKNLPFEELVALYIESDVALVTPLRDGMNLVAKEYVAAKQKRRGVLVLSEMAGVADELPEATRVNPNDREAIVRAIEEALKMPVSEQKRRLHIMQGRIARYSVGRWAEDYIEELAATRKLSSGQVELVTAEMKDKLLDDYCRAKKRLLLLDYDGTLMPFVTSPLASAAKPSQRLLGVLEQLAADPLNDTVIVSGRPRPAMELWFDRLPATLVAEHGAWIRTDGDWRLAANESDEWKDELRNLLERVTERTPGSMIEEKMFSMVWHYRNVSPELAYVRMTTLKHDAEKLLNSSPAAVFEGHKILEFKPRAITKGVAVRQLLAAKDYDFILSVGDDYTDEDMFGALPAEAYTIKVALGASQARFYLPSVEDVVKLITTLCERGSVL